MELTVKTESETIELGARLAKTLKGGETIELIGDIGAGKTTLTKAIAGALGVKDEVQSPSFTLSRIYQADHNLSLAHYDFYRLEDPGILAVELAENLADQKTIVIVEWAKIVNNVLPLRRIQIFINSSADNPQARQIKIVGMDNELFID